MPGNNTIWKQNIIFIKRKTMANSIPSRLPCLPPGKPLSIVLVGKTGQGKSEVGNTILEGKFFESHDSVESVTKCNQTAEQTVGGRVISVVDTPGVMDTEKEKKLILSEIANAVIEHPEGYDAVLMVLKYPLRMTAEELATIMQLEKLFGEEVFNYVILVFTHGDSFEAVQRRAETPITFQQFLERDVRSGKQTTLGPLLKKVDQRAVLFNNMEEDKVKRRKMVSNLIEKIESNCENGKYNNYLFEKAKKMKEKGRSLAEIRKKLSSKAKDAKCIIL